MNYQQLLDELKSLSDESYAVFNKKLLKNDNIRVIGVRIPELRSLAKKYSGDIEVIKNFPDEFYEVTFLKLTIFSRLDFNDFIKEVDYCVSLIDNWASCDCFQADCIAGHTEEFMPYIHKYLSADGEFYQRYALVTLLKFYIDGRYLPQVFECISRADTSYYYVHMAAAWLIAETLVKFYDEGVRFLSDSSLDKKTRNKAIQKATESYRLSDDRKEYLKKLKA